MLNLVRITSSDRAYHFTPK